MTNENEYDDELEVLSNCCGANIIWTDICSECKEHCDGITE